MRVMQRRFIIWQPTDVAHTSPPSGAASGGGEPGASAPGCAAAAAVPAAVEAAAGQDAAGAGNGRPQRGMQVGDKAVPRQRRWCALPAFALSGAQGAADAAQAASGTAGLVPAAEAHRSPEQSAASDTAPAPQAQAVEGELDGGPPATAAAAVSSGGGAWDRGLVGIWKEFTRRLQVCFEVWGDGCCSAGRM